MIFLQPRWIVAFVFAYCWYMGGKLEAKGGDRPDHGAYWALASIIFSAAAIQFLGGGVLLVIASQVLLFIAITLWRVTFEK